MSRMNLRRSSVRRAFAATAIAVVSCVGAAIAPSAAMEFDTDNIDFTNVDIDCHFRSDEHGISVGPCGASIPRQAEVRCAVSFWPDTTVRGDVVSRADAVSSASCGKRTKSSSRVLTFLEAPHLTLTSFP